MYPQVEGPTLVGCPRLLIQNIRSHPPYRRPFLHPQPEEAPCRGDRDPLIVNQDGLKLNGTHQLLAYADDVNILGGSVDTVKKNAEALVVATKETGLEVNAHKTKYMTGSRDQNAGRIHSMKVDNSSIERVEEFKYLGTTLTNQNSIQEEI